VRLLWRGRVPVLVIDLKRTKKVQPEQRDGLGRKVNWIRKNRVNAQKNQGNAKNLRGGGKTWGTRKRKHMLVLVEKLRFGK